MRTTSLPIQPIDRGDDGKTTRETERFTKREEVERMEGERLTERADALRVEGGRRRGRPTPRWEDCVKRDFARARGVWRTRTRDTWRGDGGETGSVTKKKEKNQRQVSVPASPWTSGCCAYLCYIRC